MDPGPHLHEMFSRQARATPDATALICGERRVRYAELEAGVNRVASALAARGLSPPFTVGLHLDRSMEWVVATLGVHAAGGTVLPLPPSYPVRRQREILDWVAPDLVVDHEETPLDPATECLSASLENLVAAGLDEPTRAPPDPDRAAFVLASSGSTAAPKLIVRSHRSFFHRLGWTWARHPFEEGDLGCHKAQVTTTHGVYELFEPLLAGAPTLILTDAEVRSLERFWDRVRAHAVSRLLLVPSALQATLDIEGFEFPALKVVVLMGEYVSPGLAAHALERLPRQSAIYSIYGSTEASSSLVCDLRESARSGQELPLGSPITETVEAMVLDTAGVPVAPGGEGRLHIRGPNLFEGYRSDPEATAAVLVSLPDGGPQAYDTRDAVRVTSGGDLHFVGRTDRTVKVRGFRVHLLEVERAMLEHAGVRQAAVVLSESGPTPRLVGFYVPETIAAGGVFETLRDRVPDYMVPASLVGLAELPLTSRSKVDHARLLRSLPTTPEEAPAAAADTPTERRVRHAWAEVLGHRGFSADQSFFEVGGTSLTVFSMVQRLRDAFDLPPAALREDVVWRFPTLAGLARHLDERGTARNDEHGSNPVLLTLRAAKHADLAPLFVVSSAGGTVGAYEKLAQTLRTDRAVVGIQDPFLWGERPAGEPFEQWIERYVSAVRERQPEGPYYLLAFSSAGAFGLEIAQRLRSAGQEVASLILVDPIGMDRQSRWRYGWWANRAIWMRGPVRRVVRVLGRLRASVSGLRDVLPDPAPVPPAPERLEAAADAACCDAGHLIALSTLMELNSGRPFGLAPSDFEGVPPDQALKVVHGRVRDLAPEMSLENIERMVRQYPLQVGAQHRYRLRPYDGSVLLFEPHTPQAGLVAEHLRPWVADLRSCRLEVGPVPPGLEAAAGRFGALDRHYRSMRDDLFVDRLARALEPELSPRRSGSA